MGAFAQNRHSDCTKAFPICKNGTYYFSEIEGPGSVNDLTKSFCRDISLEETNAVWLKFSVKKAGIITFLITPFKLKDDIDFVLYKTGSDQCTSKKDIRCMASGKNIGSLEADHNCLGVTGLDTRSIDMIEMNGCKYSDDNFLKFLDAKAGEYYTLFINNYNSIDGFSVMFDGTAELDLRDDCSDNKDKLSLQLTELYPNPSKDEINLSFFSIKHEIARFQIITLDGQSVINRNIEIKEGIQTIPFDISQLASGTYFIQISGSDNTILQKFVKG